MKPRKATFKHIEAELYSYEDTKKEIEQLRKDIMFCKESTDENTGGGRGSYISDPTAQIATKLTTHRKLESMETIVQAIEKVYEALPEERQKLIRLKYWDRPQLLTWEGIAQTLHISKRQAYRWRDEVIQAVNIILGWR